MAGAAPQAAEVPGTGSAAPAWADPHGCPALPMGAAFQDRSALLPGAASQGCPVLTAGVLASHGRPPAGRTAFPAGPMFQEPALPSR